MKRDPSLNLYPDLGPRSNERRAHILGKAEELSRRYSRTVFGMIRNPENGEMHSYRVWKKEIMSDSFTDF
jgi:hypothetical protein